MAKWTGGAAMNVDRWGVQGIWRHLAQEVNRGWNRSTQTERGCVESQWSGERRGWGGVSPKLEHLDYGDDRSTEKEEPEHGGETLSEVGGKKCVFRRERDLENCCGEVSLGKERSSQTNRGHRHRRDRRVKKVSPRAE